MAKRKIKKGAKLICVPCGREMIISNCGISTRTVWCCGRPMKGRTKALSKKVRIKLRGKKK